MMEFWSEQDIKAARKPHVCEMCGRPINIGESYCRESGKWEGDFFSRCMHLVCHEMEMEYCCEVDNEFTWSDILEYVAEVYCSKCKHALCNDYLPDHGEDCPYDSVLDCPIIQRQFNAEQEVEHEA